ncbi:hypothetical protein SAMN05443429_11264 [Cruoricaptor ignavus]|uniref:Uncharacterized protein n=1 Tax=Cruoricaptor ignavus TaxID=1118202 RepID=A0A1M6HHK4_9FLAO|nr:hypothetical protein [Cruoricaptor ignavus]SHJ21661.1 hypothetical protein SAMN05443429_11264 [Cruoricaptor ignavus]
MGQIIELDLSAFFHNGKREVLLKEYIEKWREFKWNNGGEKFRQLPEEEQKEISRRILRAMDIRNSIISDRKRRMAEAGVFDMMYGIERSFRI